MITNWLHSYVTNCVVKESRVSNTDFLIYAVVMNHDFAVFTDDKNFDLFAQHVALERYL